MHQGYELEAGSERESRLRLVHQIEPWFAEHRPEDGQEPFSVAALGEIFCPVAGQSRDDFCQPEQGFRPQEVALALVPGAKPHHLAERRLRALVPVLAPGAATPSVQPSRFGDRLNERGLARAVLPDQERYRPQQLQPVPEQRVDARNRKWPLSLLVVADKLTLDRQTRDEHRTTVAPRRRPRCRCQLAGWPGRPR